MARTRSYPIPLPESPEPFLLTPEFSSFAHKLYGIYVHKLSFSL